MTFAILLSTNVLEHNQGLVQHRKNGWRYMRVVFIAHDSKDSSEFETSVLGECFNIDMLCANRSKGGESASKGRPHVTYMLTA